MMGPAATDFRREGEQAYRQGKRLQHNPYLPGSDAAREWARGIWDAIDDDLDMLHDAPEYEEDYEN